MVKSLFGYADVRGMGFQPWVGKTPWRRAWQPTPVFLPWRVPWTEEPGGLEFIGYPLTLLVRMQTSTAAMENSVIS